MGKKERTEKQNGEILSVVELSAYLGISQSIVRRLIRHHNIPYIKLEGRYLFYLPVVQEWLRSITQPTGHSSFEQEAKEKVKEIWKSTVEK